MSNRDTLVSILLLLFVYLVPLAALLKHYDLFRKRSYGNFVRVVNGTIAVYCILAALFFLIASVCGPLVEDPEYPTADDNMILASVLLFFIMSVLVIFLPVLLLVNIINSVVGKKDKTSDTEILP